MRLAQVSGGEGDVVDDDADGVVRRQVAGRGDPTDHLMAIFTIIWYPSNSSIQNVISEEKMRLDSEMKKLI